MANSDVRSYPPNVCSRCNFLFHTDSERWGIAVVLQKIRYTAIICTDCVQIVQQEMEQGRQLTGKMPSLGEQARESSNK